MRGKTKVLPQSRTIRFLPYSSGRLEEQNATSNPPVNTDSQRPGLIPLEATPLSNATGKTESSTLLGEKVYSNIADNGDDVYRPYPSPQQNQVSPN